MKKHLLSIVLLFGLIGFACTASAQDYISSALAEGYTPEEMETLFKNVTYSNHKSYLTDKGYKFKEENKKSGFVSYHKNDVVTLHLAYTDSEIWMVGFSSSPQKWYQAQRAFEDSKYTKLEDKKFGDATYQQWERNGYIYRASSDNYMTLIVKK